MKTANLMSGALLVVEAVAAAGALSAINAAKSNTNRGTYAFAAKDDGTGGVDMDVAVGAGLLLIAAVAPASIAPHVAALGVGALSTYASRAGTNYGVKHQSVKGVPYGSFSHGHARQAFGPVDPFAQGFAAAQPVYQNHPGAHRF